MLLDQEKEYIQSLAFKNWNFTQITYIDVHFQENIDYKRKNVTKYQTTREWFRKGKYFKYVLDLMTLAEN